jgi:hypothetical protein
MFLGLPDPDPLVRDADPAPDPSLCAQKCVERTELMPPNKILRKNFSKKKNFFTEDDMPVGKL